MTARPLTAPAMLTIPGAGRSRRGSAYGVRLEGAGASVEVRLEGTPPQRGQAAIVLQHADAFNGRIVRLVFGG